MLLLGDTPLMNASTIALAPSHGPSGTMIVKVGRLEDILLLLLQSCD